MWDCEAFKIRRGECKKHSLRCLNRAYKKQAVSTWVTTARYRARSINASIGVSADTFLIKDFLSRSLCVGANTIGSPSRDRCCSFFALATFVAFP